VPAAARVAGGAAVAAPPASVDAALDTVGDGVAVRRGAPRAAASIAARTLPGSGRVDLSVRVVGGAPAAAL
jgi:hypothetical protein